MRFLFCDGRWGFPVLLSLVWLSGTAQSSDRPNVVFVLTDNHGAWTLGCYGNQDIRTPNLDALASQGVLFERAYASNPVCSPSRATFLTGLIPSQHGVHSYLTGNGLQIGPEARNTLDQITSLPEILKAEGYTCGLVGKWHLGDNLNPQEGFDDYWVTMPSGHTSTFYDASIIEHGTIRNEPQYLTDFWTDHAVHFIQTNAKADKPFFLYLAYNGPYALGRLLLQDGRNRHAAYYADKEILSFPRDKSHPWQLRNLDYHNNLTSIRRVATEISGVDDGVGTIMETLKSLGLDETTIVVFAGDQGWAGGQGGFFGMGDHTRPVTATDSMMRIPLIWRHKNAMKSGVRSDRLTSNYDFVPTLLGYLGLSDKLPSSPKSPGIDYSNELRIETSGVIAPDAEATKAVFYEFEGLRCIRTNDWKYVHREANGPHELYDLRRDPHEWNNLASSAESHVEEGLDTAAIREDLKSQLDRFYDQYAEPKYDMWRGGGSQAKVFSGIDKALPKRAPVEVPHRSDGFDPPKLNVPDGFTVELAAGPPLVKHPMFATFDEQGSLFVCENAGVNMTAEELEANLPNSIRLLRDVDGDGRFDSSTVFADKMTLPMGGAWHDGALYVASSPNLWRLEDTDGDGIADKRDIIVSRFGFNGNGCDIHGCFMGPDGRLYWCDGYHGHKITDVQGNVTSERKGSYLFSCRTDGSDVRLICGGGMDNPVEVDFTEDGEMLGTVNILYSRPRVDCFMHWLHGGAYPHREQVLDELQTTGDLLAPMHRFGHVAASGTLRYRSGVLDYRWRDHFFATQFNTGKVVKLEMVPHGSTYSAMQREFLSSTNRDFHPTDIVEDADGSLLVIDTGGWYYRGCPTSQHAKPEILGGIYRIRRDGMTSPVDPRGTRIDWEALPTTELLNALYDTRTLVRDRAVVQCVRRGENIVDFLSVDPSICDVTQRRNTVWALTGIIGEAKSPASVAIARATIRQSLNDLDAGVRLAACHSLSTYPDPTAIEPLLVRLEQDTPAIKRQAATALGRCGDSRVIDRLLESLIDVVDRSQEHAIIYALIELDDPDTTRSGLRSKDANVRRGALIALDQMKSGDLNADDVIACMKDPSDELRKTSVVIFAKHDDWSSRSADVLKLLLNREDTVERNAVVISQLIAGSTTVPAMRTLIGSVLGDSTASMSVKKSVLLGIASGTKTSCDPSWIEPMQHLLASDDESLVRSCIQAFSSTGSEAFADGLAEIAQDRSRPPLLRVDAMQVNAVGGQLVNEALHLLIETIENGSPSQSAEAIQRVGAATLSPEQLVTLSPLLARLGPSSLSELMRPFERTTRLDVGKSFLDSIGRSDALTSLEVNQFSDVIKLLPKELLPRANELLETIRVEDESKRARLDRYLSTLPNGDIARGKELFFSSKSTCSSCHRIGDQGANIGPNLSAIGANRSAPDLIEAIVFPSATIVRDYESYNVLTADGRVINGTVAKETKEAIFIQQKSGEPISISLDEVESITPTAVSIMPGGLDQVLSADDLIHVVAYLQSCKDQSGQVESLTSSPIEDDGFRSLFNGKSLDGWIGATDGYEVQDDAIVCSQSKGGNLFYDQTFANFILQFEVNIPEGGNSGVGIRSPFMLTAAAYEGTEVQIIDDHAAIYESLKPYQRHGSLYGLVAAKTGSLKPTGEWNAVEITVDHQHVKVVCNGIVIVDVDLVEAVKDGTLDGREHPGLKRTDGYIGFLGHGAPVRYRKIQIKELQ